MKTPIIPAMSATLKGTIAKNPFFQKESFTKEMLYYRYNKKAR